MTSTPISFGDGSVPASTPTPAPERETALTETPTVRTGLAFLHLDDPIDRALTVLGPPDQRAPDINASLTHTWRLAAGAELAVTADEVGILGLYAHVPTDSPVRLSAYGGILIGVSSPARITDSWGDDYDLGHREGDDFVLRYVECLGPFPVVVKFDQNGAAPDIRWHEPATSLLIAYADAEPGTQGCPPS